MKYSGICGSTVLELDFSNTWIFVENSTITCITFVYNNKSAPLPNADIPAPSIQINMVSSYQVSILNCVFEGVGGVYVSRVSNDTCPTGTLVIQFVNFTALSSPLVITDDCPPSLNFMNLQISDSEFPLFAGIVDHVSSM